MTKELLFEAIGGIDDAFIDEAKMLFDKQPKMKLWKKFALTAACFVAVFVAAFPFLSDILSPVLDTRHKENTDNPPNEISGIPVVNEVPKKTVEVSPDNIIAVNPAVNNPPLFYNYPYQYYKELNESEKTEFEKTFTEETGYILSKFASSLSRIYPTNAENVCLENSYSYVFSCELDVDNREYADVCIASKERYKDKYFDPIFFLSSNDFYAAPLSEPIVMSEISGVSVKIFLLNKKYPGPAYLINDKENDGYKPIYDKMPVYIAIFENDKVNFQVEAFTGDVSKLELLITAILTTPVTE